MAAPTDVQRLQDFLRTRAGAKQRAHRRTILAGMGLAGLGWDEAKLDRLIARARADPHSMICTLPGGTVAYVGSEVAPLGGVGLYEDVKRILKTDWARAALRVRAVDTFSTSITRQGLSGDWTRPDMVFAAHPLVRRSRADRKLLHAVEIETIKGFSIKSVYQAHAQARGADYAWVFTFAGSLLPSALHSDDELWSRNNRVRWAADQLGVGLVTFANQRAKKTYKVVCAAQRLQRSPAERNVFLDKVMRVREDDPRLD